MSVHKDLATGSAGHPPRLDLLSTLGRLGVQTMRMRLFVGGLMFAAIAITALCLVIHWNLSAATGSSAQVVAALEAANQSIVYSGVAIFALSGLAMFLLSANVTAAIDSKYSSHRRRLEQELSQLNSDLIEKDEQFARLSSVVKNHDLLLSIIENLEQAIFSKDRSGRYEFVNRAFCARVQRKPEEILGKTALDVLRPEQARVAIEEENRIIETAEPVRSLITEPTPTGGIAHLQLQRSPRYDLTGAIAGTQGIIWDVTESKNAEAALEREGSLLSALMNSGSDLIYFKDRESRFMRLTASHARLFGLNDPALAIGKSDFDFFTREHAQAAYDDEQRIVRTGEAMIGIEERETWADREDTWASTTKSPLYDSNGNIIGIFGITRDITEKKRAEQTLTMGLAEFLEFTSKVSEGDLTLRAKEGDDTLGQVARSVNKMLDNFSAMLTNVKQLGFSVSSSATQILVAADEIAQGTQRQTDETTSITSSVEEMAATMGQVSKNAESSADAARRALVTAERGDQSVRDTSEAMQRINVAVEQTAEKMRLLAQRSAEISDIIDLINEIAAQTNLLALNAAIEAAHAGEAGLGFSVVAEEIRKLADRSATATRDVGDLIKRIQVETPEAIAAMEKGMREVKDGTVLAEQSRKSLQDISNALRQSAESVEEIYAASEEQTQVTRALANAMHTISSITMQVSAGSHQTADIIHGLADLADKLNRSISQFKVSEDFMPMMRQSNPPKLNA
ncbi:MAG TPA: methyl-accepting chemotaxis protein [Blastocatellia bacterium]|nr:methyl-accepting chemotaxis protein [Blastocatellia bacterium]